MNICIFIYIYILTKIAIDFIDKMLQLDPNDRMSCEDALAHPYLRTFHDIEDEPEGEPFDDLYELQDYPVHDWKSDKNF